MDRMRKIETLKNDTLRKNDTGTVGIDLMAALVLFIAGVFTAVMILPSLSHEDRDWRIRQYMAATRATDSLVQDAGEPGWEPKWASGDFSNVTGIGFIYINPDGKPVHKVLDEIKVETLMGAGYPDTATGTLWWEFPNSSTGDPEIGNAARALGLSGYNFYMQLHPVGLDPGMFNSTPLEENLSNVKGINFDTATVIDRYVFIKDPSDSSEGAYLKDYDNNAVHYRLNLWVW